MSEVQYPAMGEKVALKARIVGVRKHDVESYRTVTVQLSDGQGVTTNLKNITREVKPEAKAEEKSAEKPEDKAIPAPVERRDIPGPRHKTNRR